MPCKVVILAGGLGTRLSEETVLRPKPMVEIGGRPILWHIMQIYASHGFCDFMVACGYKAEVIKEYFHNFYLHNTDSVVNLADGSFESLDSRPTNWKVGLIDTGVQTQTGGRLLRMKRWLGNETFMATYGDGVGNINIRALYDYHRSHGKLATVTATRPPSRFGELIISDQKVLRFSEKPQTGSSWINGGFFVFEPEVLNYIPEDSTILESQVLEGLAADGQLMAYQHNDFWQPMDTLREKHMLEAMWQNGTAPWKVW